MTVLADTGPQCAARIIDGDSTFRDDINHDILPPGGQDVETEAKLSSDKSRSANSQEASLRYASSAGAAAVFQEEICKAVRNIAVRHGEAELRASITIKFPLWGRGAIDCLLSMHICPWAVSYFAQQLFGAQIVMIGSVRRIVLKEGITVIVPGTEVTLKGVEEDTILKVFGSEMLDAVKESSVRGEEISQGVSATECVSMIVTEDGAIVSLALGLARGLQIQRKLDL
ncbi:hypothetical protein HRG_001623 [Hirsutella rhossiliensis]|uniref:Uncharacterized protein n=1 Tax=Hirsutella rhossiliensis TaxID=111463 RepID=A0A9P8SLF8_9HYPO|nr:uncharacterized protein HRG_01623 [Hirsutella rhossiliensis]KAH0966214.1 hypothetical protein HRG_01623 [Hirsutella rhossiliensis]